MNPDVNKVRITKGCIIAAKRPTQQIEIYLPEEFTPRESDYAI